MRLAHAYAQALFDVAALSEGALRERALDNFIALIEHRGHRALLPRIKKEYEKIREKHKGHGAELACASEAAVQKYAKEVMHLVVPREMLNTKVDETLVGGFVFRKKDTMIDASHKRFLLTVYKNSMTP